MLANIRSMSAPHFVGRSENFLRVVALIERMARFDAPVLITGETGTGKELAARAIHYLSQRRDAPFVPVNCGAIPDALIETELFGCERGAFTDARHARAGLVAAAEGGTLFLDEIDALPPRAQVSLLRFLQDRVYRPIGGVREQHGNVRVVVAASPRLHQMLNAGAFRDDLAFRLKVLMLEMPPLRDRAGDAVLLAEHFIARYSCHYGVPPRALDAHGREWLETYPWPGNVRELDNLVQRALLLGDGEGLCLSPDTTGLPARTAVPSDTPENLPSFNEARDAALRHFERQYLVRLMKAAAGNVTHAACLCGKERRVIGKLLKKHGLSRLGLDDIGTTLASAS